MIRQSERAPILGEEVYVELLTVRVQPIDRLSRQNLEPAVTFLCKGGDRWVAIDFETMTDNASKLTVKSLLRLLTMFGLLAACYSLVVAQSAKPLDSNGADKGALDDTKSFASMEEEMRAKLAIKMADREYQDNLAKARDLSFLGAEISKSVKEKNSLDREGLKKLEKAEKLAKNIRSAAGGSEDEVAMEKPPKDLASASCMFAELTESLKDKVEKTPKHVVSATVIDEANVLLELIRLLRILPPKV